MKLHEKHLLHYGRRTVIGLAVLLTIGFAASSQATEINSLSFASLGPDTTNRRNINAATTFTMGSVLSKVAGELGIFVGLPAQEFGSVSFNATIPTSFTFGNGVFGHFASTSITEIANTPGVVAFFISGNWTPGTFSGFEHLAGGPFPATIDISFDQTPAHIGSVSTSFTFATTTPEPGTLGLLGTGLIGLAGMVRRQLRLGSGRKSGTSNCCWYLANKEPGDGARVAVSNSAHS